MLYETGLPSRQLCLPRSLGRGDATGGGDRRRPHHSGACVRQERVLFVPRDLLLPDFSGKDCHSGRMLGRRWPAAPVAAYLLYIERRRMPGGGRRWASARRWRNSALCEAPAGSSQQKIPGHRKAAAALRCPVLYNAFECAPEAVRGTVPGYRPFPRKKSASIPGPT